jgi:hypothetical protein
MISYTLQHNLNKNAIKVLRESIPPLVNFMTKLMEEDCGIDDFLFKIRETGYTVIDWMNSQSVNKNEVWIYLINSSSCSCKMVLDLSGYILQRERDYKIRKIFD